MIRRGRAGRSRREQNTEAAAGFRTADGVGRHGRSCRAVPADARGGAARETRCRSLWSARRRRCQPGETYAKPWGHDRELGQLEAEIAKVEKELDEAYACLQADAAIAWKMQERERYLSAQCDGLLLDDTDC